MYELKEKLNISDRRKKVQILTLVPDRWSIDQVSKFFCMPNYLARQASQQKINGGILSLPLKQTRNRISDDLQEKVKAFYESDEVARMCFGKKDCVKVTTKTFTKEKVQKRLLLANLHEIYVQFKNETNEKIGFSTFCALKPKWCVTVGASRTHSVCICTKHQSSKLMIAAVDKKLHCRDLMAMFVCNLQSKDCMLHHCDHCPNILVLKNFLIGKLRESYDQDDAIPFKKWQTMDRSNLEGVELGFYDFLDEVSDQIRNLTVHHFIVESQNKYFKYAKNYLSEGECVTVLDFADNYSLIVQEAVQGFHWNSSQATIHPFVIYYVNSEKTGKIV